MTSLRNKFLQIQVQVKADESKKKEMAAEEYRQRTFAPINDFLQGLTAESLKEKVNAHIQSIADGSYKGRSSNTLEISLPETDSRASYNPSDVFKLSGLENLHKICASADCNIRIEIERSLEDYDAWSGVPTPQIRLVLNEEYNKSSQAHFFIKKPATKAPEIT